MALTLLRGRVWERLISGSKRYEEAPGLAFFFPRGFQTEGSFVWLLRYVVKSVALLGVSHHWSNWLVKAGVFMRLAIPNGQLSTHKSPPCLAVVIFFWRFLTDHAQCASRHDAGQGVLRLPWVGWCQTHEPCVGHASFSGGREECQGKDGHTMRDSFRLALIKATIGMGRCDGVPSNSTGPARERLKALAGGVLGKRGSVNLLYVSFPKRSVRGGEGASRCPVHM